MFYLKEVFYRINYFFYTFVFVFLYFYSIKEYFLTLVISSISHKKNFYLQNFEISFVLNSPNQLIDLDVSFCFITTLVFIWPLLLLQIFYFFRPVLKQKQISLFQKNYPILLGGCVLWNYTLMLYLFPYFWSLTEFFNMLFMLQSNINVEYEPNLLFYLKSLWLCFKITNLCFLFYFSIFLAIQKFSLELKGFLKNEKSFNLILLCIFFIYLGLTLEIHFLITFFYFLIILLIFYFLKKAFYLNSLFLYIKDYEIKKTCKIH